VRRRAGGFAPLLALVALILQSLVPIAHAAAMAAYAAPGTIVICTAEGLKQVHVAEDGSLQPVEPSGKLPPACPGCPIGGSVAALLPPGQPEIGIAFAASLLPPPAGPAASPASPRYPPSQPRAPPASI